MTIRNKKELEGRPIEIDLTGPDGNASVLLGIARKYAKQLGLDDKIIIEDMMSGDYEHLVDTFEDNFGSFVTLYR
jgi:hypothetical protein